MRKTLLPFALILLGCFTSVAQSKFDNGSQMAINHYKELLQNPAAEAVKPLEMPFVVGRTSRGVAANAGAIITLAPGATFSDIEAVGLVIEVRLGDDMCVATGNIDDIIALEDNEAVRSVSLGGRSEVCLDYARDAIGMDKVHGGVDLPDVYKGKGVICGIFDTGLDPNHINFYNSDMSENRVRAVYSFIGSNGVSINYETPDRIASFTSDNRNGTHGTHTTGCMAGSFNRASGTAANGMPVGKYAALSSPVSSSLIISSTKKNPYYGMAPEADIVIGCGTLYDANIVSGLGKIVEYGKQTGQPVVINLSIGQNVGPHDGSDALSQAIGRAGKDAIVCISAGNEGDSNISYVSDFTSAEKSVKSMIKMSATSSGMIDIWSSSSVKFNVKIAVVNYSTGEVIYECKAKEAGETVLATNNFTSAGYIHDASFENAFNQSYVIVNADDNKSTNNRYSARMQYNIRFNTATNADKSVGLAFIVEGEDGQRVDVVHKLLSGDAFITDNGLEGWTAGTPDFSISTLACADNVIAVGAWSTRSRWGTLGRSVYMYNDHSSLGIGQVCGFSSYGTTYDGRNLPHILSPGAGIISSLSSYYTTGKKETDYIASYTYNNRNYMWSVEQGTSMASPIVAGTIATWLQYDPTLKVEKVRDILMHTADFDNDCREAGEVKSGAGKMNAYDGLKEVIRTSGVGEVAFERVPLLKVVGMNMFEVFNPGNKTEVAVYDMTGVKVESMASDTDTLTVDLNGLQHGIYILNVKDGGSHRVMVR